MTRPVLAMLHIIYYIHKQKPINKYVNASICIEVFVGNLDYFQKIWVYDDLAKVPIQSRNLDMVGLV